MHLKTKLSAVIFLALFLLVSSAYETHAESKYTREKSEELFHLIKWHEYSPETFIKALEEQKPVFLVVSAPSWCYWCHVYESEDYLYHPFLYPYINDNFIAVFVDSDKRPDLTKKYLEGGWPSTTILTPDLRRITGFSGPKDPYVLRDYFEKLVGYLADKSFTDAESELDYEQTDPLIPEQEDLQEVERIFLKYTSEYFDPDFGGFLRGNIITGGYEQKFPAGLAHKYLLEKYDETGNEGYLNIVKTTFNNQYTELTEIEERYRLYDPVEGGFHRYSTQKDWSVPHYEKMLDDQARLIRSYAHLFKITGEDKVRHAVEGAASYVIDRLYDRDGGFYSSQDAYLEEDYYGLTKEGREKLHPPYIDKTRKMDFNSMMISTFLYLYDLDGNRAYGEAAKKSLDFLKGNMTGRQGAYYYFDHEKKKAYLTGQSVANSWAALAFLDGYLILKEKKYLETAIDTAEYSLEHLYDWNSGGFFERNSVDTGFYAPGENIDLSKPYRENAVFSYVMLRLYLITGEIKYLEGGIKTLGYVLSRTSRLNDVYYSLRAAQLVIENSLTDVYFKSQKKVDGIIEQGKRNFFLDKLFVEKQESVQLDNVPALRDSFFNAGFIALAVLAFISGILSFMSPCTLPVLSAYFAYGFNTGKGEVFRNTVFFFLGLATVFSLFGMGATMAGSFLRENRTVFTQVAAVVIIIFGVLEIFGKGFSGMNINLKSGQKTPVGSYLFGAVFAIGWSACIGPILASLLLLSATAGTVMKGSALLFIYALGLAVPLMLISPYFDSIRSKRIWSVLQGKAVSFTIFNRQIDIHSTSLVSGLILIVLGTLIFNDYLYKLNQFALQTDYVQDFLIRGEEFLKETFIK